MDLLPLLKCIALRAVIVTVVVGTGLAIFGIWHPTEDNWAEFLMLMPSLFGLLLMPVAIVTIAIRVYRNAKNLDRGPREFRVSTAAVGFKSKYRIKTFAWLVLGWGLGLSLENWSSSSGRPQDWLNAAGLVLFFVLAAAAFRSRCEGCQTSALDFIIGEKKMQTLANLSDLSRFVVSKRCTMCDLERH